MTVKQLYEWAKKRNLTNAKIVINYVCDDDWYNLYDRELSHKDLMPEEDVVMFEIIN